MKFNHNNKKSFSLITFFSFLAIATAVLETTAIKPASRNQNSNPAIEQQLQEPNQPKALIPNGEDRSGDENWKEIDPEQELENILGDDSEDELLLAGRSL